MSRWSSVIPRRGDRSGTGRGTRRPAVEPHGGTKDARGQGAVGAPPVEDVDGVLLVRSVDDDSFPLDTLLEVAGAVGTEEDVVTVIVGSAADGAEHWARLGALLDTLRSQGTDRVRLVMPGAGDDRPERPGIARRIADAWELEVIAPDGAVLVTPGGVLFVHGTARPGPGWWRFAPGEAPRRLGPRAPAPAWQEALGRVPVRTTGGCVVDRIPAGVVIRPAEAPGPTPDDLCFAVPVDFERPMVLVGAPQAEDVAADEVAAVLATLPVAQRSRVRLAPGGRRDLLRLGQSVADQLGAEVEVLTGLPLIADHAPPGTGPRPTLVGRDGRPSWQPFVSAVVCGPTDAEGRTPAPRPVATHMPDWILGGTGPGTVRLTDRWHATVTRAGLALWTPDGPRPGPVGPAVDPEVCAIELGMPGQPLDGSLLPALSRLLRGLGADTRARTTLLVRGRLLDGDGELRRLAAEHGVPGIRYVTAARPTGAGTAARHPGTAAVGAPARPPGERPSAAAAAPPPNLQLTSLPAPSPTGRRTEPGAGTEGGRVATAGADAAPAGGGPPGRPAPGSTTKPAHTSGGSRMAEDTARSGGTPERTTPETAPNHDTGNGTAGADNKPAAPSGGSRVGGGVARGGGVGPGAESGGRTGSVAGAVPGGGAGEEDEALNGGRMPEVKPAAPSGGSPAGATVRTVPEAGAEPEPGAEPGAEPEPEPGAETGAGSRAVPPGLDAGGTGAGGTGGAPRGAGTGRRAPQAETRPVSASTSASEASPDPASPAFRAGAGAGAGIPGTPAPQAAPVPGATPAPAAPKPSLRPVRPAHLPFVPGHVSGAAEQAAFRDFAAGAWEAHAAAVSRLLTRMPALRGHELDAARIDLVAAHAYLTTDEGPLHHRELIRDLHSGEGRLLPYAGCLASALRRLPSYRGVALRGGDPVGPEPGVGTLLQDPGPVSALAGTPVPPAGTAVRYAIWSVTGRKVRQLIDRPTGPAQTNEEIVFVPGTGFRVLGVRSVPAGPSVVLLRELPGNATAYMDGSEELSGLDLKALAHLEEALSKENRVGEGRGWPERCTGPVGQDG
ncbi:hypothetical protein [Streptomyces sp. NEAU-W12]|uniref:hypothetical protein n=1 Tax=Streptomyces sp. NEAU-W12 TaxID=2994668 RepID=UPI00224B450C|nr:hypothetical protein [Streptomyces sp. NEAU-W12]MCX2923765.1 hypothetical protein [Streptomyces sp. NEAU-W12]